jgi:hypothetical protein
MNKRGKAMTDREILTWREEAGEDLWNERLAGDEGGTWLVGEDPNMCCIALYLIGKINGDFKLFSSYADLEDPVRRENVFETAAAAKVAAEAAYHRLIPTKFWHVVCDEESFFVGKLNRDHRPGCPVVVQAGAYLGCPASEAPTQWLIERGLLVKRGNRYALTSKAEAILNEQFAKAGDGMKG